MPYTYQIKDLLKLCTDTAKKHVKNVYPTTRPRSVSEKMNEFAVVSLPVETRNLVYGGSMLTETIGSIDLFVRDKGGVENVDRLDELINSVCGDFPVKRDNLRLVKPRVTLRGSDKMGFHVASVDFDVKTI